MLRVHAQKLEEIAILCLQGRIVIGETNALRDAVHSQSDVGTVVLDLARVSRVDARGLGVLLELREQTRSNGMHLKLMNVTRRVHQVLDITRLNSVFEVTTRAELLKAISVDRPVSVPATELAFCA